MSRYRDPQLQVTEHLCDLRNLSPNIYLCFLTTDYTGASK